MLVYRLENESGVGPFWGDVEDDIRHHCHRSRFRKLTYSLPCPAEDPGINRKVRQGEYCGCANPEDLWDTWHFQTCMAALVRNHFEVVVYEVDPEYVSKGEYQLLFHKDLASPIARKPVKTAYRQHLTRTRVCDKIAVS